MLLRCIEIYWVILPRANFLLRPTRQAETRELPFPLCQVPGAAAGLQPQHCATAGLARRPSPAAASRVWDFMMPDKVPVVILFPLSALLLGCCVGWQLPGDRTGALHPTPFPFEAAVILPMPSPFPPLPFPWRGRGPTCPGSGRGLAATTAVPLALLPACFSFRRSPAPCHEHQAGHGWDISHRERCRALHHLMLCRCLRGSSRRCLLWKNSS